MLYQMLEWFRSQKQEEGQTLVEYALILVLIAIVVIVTMKALGVQVDAIFTEITTGLLNAGT